MILAEKGFEVDLFEASGRLGGRAASFLRANTGTLLDTGQHVLLGCCTNLLDFYSRLGALDHIRFLDSMTFAKNGMQSHLHPGRFPEPFHLVPSLLLLRQLRMSDKLWAFRLLSAAVRSDIPSVPADYWLSKAGQSKHAINTFWSPILTGALNDTLDRVSARYAAMVIRQAMLINRDGFSLGVPTVPLSLLHDEISRQVLARLGVRIHMGRKVTRIVTTTDKVYGIILNKNGHFDADYFVLAVDPATAQVVLPSNVGLAPEALPEYSSIVTAYLWYDHDVDIPTALCIAGKHFGWCFRKPAFQSGRPEMSCEIAVVASAARELVGLSDNEIHAICIEELNSALGRRFPEPDDFAVVRHAKATFSPSVAYDKVRPPQSTSLTNLFLAGDWTDTGWPGTMESAVRSGYACARSILACEGIESSVPVPDIPPRSPVARMMAFK